MMKKYFKSPFRAVEDAERGASKPSPFTIYMATEKKTKYVKEEYETKYEGTKPILVACTDEALMEMANKTKFDTGNHPIEMYGPLLYFRDAGFTFEFATISGGPVELEMWAFPENDENVKQIHKELEEKREHPKKLSDIANLDDYAALFIPGGHGCMINLPKSKDLGRLLHVAHERGLPTVTLCHGPATLLSTALEKDFAYDGYEIMCFTDKTDAMTPSIGYLPGKMPWKCQEELEKKGIKVLNKTEKGEVHQDRELITGDSPKAAINLGKFAAPILVKYAIDNNF